MLLVGPPGSGKSFRVLAELESALASGRQVTLVVPTASMAEHLLHQAARRGLAMSPGCVLPLAGFVESYTPECRELPAATELLMVERALETAAAPEFAAVAGYPGFHARLLDTMKEFWSAGADGKRLEALAGANRQGCLTAFARVMVEYEKLLQKAGAVHRAQRLRIAAGQVKKQKLGSVFFDGFFNLTAAEMELLQAVADSAERLIVTLPESGAEDARRALAQIGMKEILLDRIHRPRPRPVIVRAPSPEREIEDVAGRILTDRRKTGRPFQEYGLIVRSPELYGPVIAVVFERFGIPFRSRQPQGLYEHNSIRYLAGLLRLAVTGFDGAATLAVMKLAGSGLANDRQMDAYEFALREQAPGRGLEFLRRHAEPFPRVKDRLAKLEELAGCAADRLPPTQWATRCSKLAKEWFHPPAVQDEVSHETALDWRALACALRGWAAAAGEAAEALRLRGTDESELAGYLEALDAVLRLTPLRTPDRRRNVVQVLSAYEARQWELPVVFVCGLVEKQFPRYHPQNLFFPDGQRRGFCLSGIQLRTSEDLDREERFLFELATTRATEQLYLTYPARDEGGTETLRSFFLEQWEQQTTHAERFRPREPAPRWRPAPAFLRAPELLCALTEKHERLSPSALEQYLQCPFQFFAARSLRLQNPPVAPDQRIDELLKGTIIHRTIARWTAQGGGEIGPVLEEVFGEVCAQEGIRLNFRAEAMKMELRADLERFAEYERDRPGAAGFQTAKPESEFEYVVDEGVDRPFRVAGRIDRYEVSDTNAAMVVDYKYSRKERIRRLVEEHEEGVRVQGPLYLLGLENQMGLTPAGMLFYGLRKEISRLGWFAAGSAPPDPDLCEKDPREFRSMLEGAARRTLEAVTEIRGGRVEVKPRDLQVCREYCPYRQVCRVNLWGYV